MPRAFTLLSRPDCHLCEEFEAQLAADFAEEMMLDVVHIDYHPQWLSQYGNSIPVLLDHHERFVCAVTVDAAAVAFALTT